MKNYHDYKHCIDLCLNCAAVCQYCASMDLKEKEPAMMARCSQLDMECAAICTAAAQLMSLGSAHVKEICEICKNICNECADECAKHNSEHCKECADACRKCADACSRM